MQKKRMLSQFFLILFSSATFLFILIFQNCSGNKFGTADLSQVDENTTLEAGRSRTISMSSKYNSELNAQPVKVALIVDNSTTMLNSQINLARNLSSLFSELSKYDADVAVLSTSWNSYRDFKTESIRIDSKTTKNITRTNFSSQFVPVFKISKNDSDDAKNLKYKDIGDAVKRLGTDGDDKEAGLQTLAFAIQGMTDFFSDNSRVLVYIITDENNLAMAEYVRKYVETVVRELPQVRVTRDYVTASYKTFFVSRLVTRPIYRDGVLIEEETFEETKPAASIADCNSKHNPPDSVCSIDTVTNSRFQASSNWCVESRSKPGYLITSCVVTQETTLEDASETTIVKDEPLFFMGLTEHNSLSTTTESGKAARRQRLHLGLRDLLDTKFKDNYLIAAQANIQGQQCNLSQGQSYDMSLQEFFNVLPGGQAMISSICDSSAASGLSLKKISERLDTIISKSYRLIKAQNEVINEVRIVISGIKTRLNETQYKLENGYLVITDSSLDHFQSLEVDLRSI